MLDWKHTGTVPYGTRVYHVWESPHPEGYTAYQLTQSRDVPPQGSGHYTNRDGLLSRFHNARFIPDGEG